MFCAQRVRRTVGPLAIGTALTFFTAAPTEIAAGKQGTGRSCPYAHTSIAQASAASMRAAVVCVINHERARWHLPALRENGELDRAAAEMTSRLVRTRVFAHGDTGARAHQFGYHWTVLGENVASGFPTPAAVVSAWMGSAGHCRNILDPGYRNIGVAGAVQPVSGVANRSGTWTADFGRRMGQRARSANGGPAAGCPH